MGILQKLAELNGSAIVTLGDVRLKVGQSDRDAAIALLKFLDEFMDSKATYTYGDAEGILLGNLLNAMHSVIKPQQDTVSYKDIMEDRNCRTLLDCLWWFRFIAALAEDTATAGGNAERDGGGTVASQPPAGAVLGAAYVAEKEMIDRNGNNNI